MFKNIDKKVFFPSFLVLFAITICVYVFPDQTNEIIAYAFEQCTDSFGWLFLLAALASFGFLIWLTIGKYGDVVLGEVDEKPQYKDLSWIAMLFTAGVGTSIVILGFLEPIYYVSAPPFDIAAFSKEAYEYGHMYGQFHWGLSAWSMYNPAIIAVAYCMFVRKDKSMRLSNACKSVLGRQAQGWAGYLIDVLVVFGIVGSISTSLGIGAPVLSAIIQKVFTIPPAYDFQVQIAVIIIWMFIFGSSVYRGLDKGIQKLSNINVVMAFLFMLFILLVGPTVQILEMEVNSLGLYITEFFRMSSYSDPFGDGIFSKDWTIFYWGWWAAFVPMMGMFVGKISRGRTIRNVAWGQMIWGTLGCCFSFMIFGGYSLYLQFTGKVDLAAILNQQGQAAAIIAILETLPFAKIMMVFLCIVCFIYLATTIDSCAYVLAGTTTKELGNDVDPARWNRILWAVVFSVFSIGLMYIGGVSAVKTIAVLTGLPLVFVLFILMAAVKRMLAEDHKDTG